MSSVEEHIRIIESSLPEGTLLVAVSKFRPISQLQQVYGCGQRVFAESRPLEFAQKVSALPKDIKWHFIGHLQTNKLKYVLPHVSLVHSADSVHLIDAIEKYSEANSLVTNILIEVHIGRETTKQGFTPEEAMEFARNFRQDNYPAIRVCGLMGMASHTDDEAVIDDDFARMETLFNTIKDECPQLGDFKELSIGMSADWPIAIRHHATMVRIGSAIFD